MKTSLLIKKMTALIIASSMVISLLPGNSVFAEPADGTDDKSITTESRTEEDSFSAGDRETTEQSDSAEASTEETTEATTEVTTEQKITTETTTEYTTEDTTEEKKEEVTTQENTEEVTTEQPATEQKEKADEKSSGDKKNVKEDKTSDKKDDKSSKDDKKTDMKESSEEKDEENDTEPEIIPTFNQNYDGVDVSGLDFSSCELLIATSDSSIFTQDTEVVSEYKGIYLTRYPDQEQTKSAYTYYYNRCDFIDVNSTIRANDKESDDKSTEASNDSSEDKGSSDDDEADPEQSEEIPNDGHGEANLTDLNTGDDALSNISETTPADYSGCIALIDSGASGNNVIGSVTVLGGTVADDNGHGTKMAEAMVKANSDVRILSIKALGSDATGTVADVYAAIQYAIKANVSVINLSMSSVVSADSDVLTKAVSEAQAAGIKVVASAGNNGRDAAYYVPGNISGVITVGACDKDGNRIASSNYGSVVSYYVTAESTSVAAATFSAILAANGLDKITDNEAVFTAEYVNSEKQDKHTTTDADDKSEETTEDVSDSGNEETKEIINVKDEVQKPTQTLPGISSKSAAETIREILLKGSAESYICVNATLTGYGASNKSGANFELTSVTVVSPSTITSDDIVYSYSWCASGHDYLNPLYGGNTITANNVYLKYEYTQDGIDYYATMGTSDYPHILNPKTGGTEANYQVIGLEVGIEQPDGAFLALHKYNEATEKNLANVWFAVYGRWTKGEGHDNKYYRIGYMCTDANGKADTIYDDLSKTLHNASDSTYAGGLSKQDKAWYGSDYYYVVELGYYREAAYKATAWSSSHSKFFYNPTIALAALGDRGSNSWQDASNVASTISAMNSTGSYYHIDSNTGASYHRLTCNSTKGTYSNIYEQDTKNLSDSDKHTINNGSVKYVAVKKIDAESKDPIANIEMSFYKMNGESKGSLISKMYTTQNGIAYISLKTYTGDIWVEETGAKGTAVEHFWNIQDDAGNYVNRNKHCVLKNKQDSKQAAIDAANARAASDNGVIQNYGQSYIVLKKVPVGVKSKVDTSKIKFHFYKSDGTLISANSNVYSIKSSKQSDGSTIFYVTFARKKGTTIYFTEDKTAAASAGFDTSIVPKVSGATAVDSTKKNVYSDYYKFTTKGSSDTDAINITVKDYKTTSVKVNKKIDSGYADYVKDNPNYSLNGVKFELYTDAAYTDHVGDITLTEANGTITSSTLVIPDAKLNKTDDSYLKTDFYWKETGAKGYKNLAGVLENVNPSDNKELYEITATNTPGTDPLNITLYKEGSSGNPTGGQSLEGAEFTVKFYPQDITKDFDNTKSPSKTWTFETKEYNGKYRLLFQKDFKVSGSNDWFDSTTNKLELPFGYFTVEETKAPDGYDTVGSFVAKNAAGDVVGTAGTDGILVLKSDTSGTESGNSVVMSLVKIDEDVRADLDITKVDADGKPMAGVEFKVTRYENGKALQSVTLVTDENGFVSTAASYVSHKTDTNSGKAKTGTWFGELGADGKVLAEKIDDKFGALPVGTYKIKELRCAANEGKQLEVFNDITVTKTDDKKTFHLLDSNASEADGKVWNYKNPIIKTTARVIETDSKTLAQVGSDIDSTNQTIEDTVSYDRLRRDTEYTVLTELMVVDKYNNVTLYTDKSGNTRRQIKAFKTEVDYKKSRYEITASQKVDITGVDPAGYEEEQKKFVVYQTLFLGTYNSLEELDQAIADKSYKTRYDEFDEEDSMDFFPVEHKQADDENQTVRPGDIHTTIKDSVSESRIAMPGTKSSHVDTSYYTGLTPGKEATVVGTIQVKEGSDWSKITYDPKNPAADKDGFVYSTENSGENKIYTLRDANGNPVTASTTFIPKTSSGYVDLTFNFDSSLLAGKSIVAFEQLMYNGKVIMVHANPMDEDETIHYPEIKTSTRNALINPSQITEENKYSAKEVLAADGQSFIDTVHSINLIANNTFRFKGTLVDSFTGEVLKDASGKEIKATKDFTTDDIKEVEVTKSPDAFNYTTADGTLLDMAADHANYMYTGDIDVEFTGYDFSNLAAVRGTVFEEVYLVKDGKEILIGEHKDLNDVEQFVRFIKIQTSAKDILTDSRILPLNVETTVEDEVTYEGLLPGSKYSFTTTLVVSNDKSGKYKDGEELKVNGKPVEVKYSFIPKTANGVEKVRIKVNTTNFTTRDITIFEELKNSFGLTIAFHKDLKDKNQTLHVPDIGTKATVNGAKSITTDGKVTIDDEVDITNLVVEKGTKATLKGILMDKATGKELKINGKTVTQEKTFEVNDANESQHLKFSFTAKNFSGDVVVYERLYINGVEVASETDINNEDQTINITPPTPPSTPPTTPPSKPPVKTGDSLPIIPVIIIMISAMGGIIGTVFFKRRRNK